MNLQSKHLYEFGLFRLDAGERLLLRESEPVPLTPKAFDLLLVLVKRHGHLLVKEELFQAVWPDSFVEESNLSSNIALIRKALGEGESGQRYIETIPKRGYRFVAEVREVRSTSDHDLILENAESQADKAPPAVASLLPNKASRWARPVIILALGLLVGVTVWAVWLIAFRGAPAAPPAEIKSLAVLPFRPLDPAAKDDYLGFGLANEIITKVSQVSGLTVRPTSAVRRYAAQEVDAISAAKQLRVDAVVDGTYQQINDRLRVSVNLLRVADGGSLWAQSFDLRAADVFALQDEVSQRVAQHLRRTLSATEQARLAKRYTSIPEAYEYYVKGQDGLDRWNVSRAELESAIGKFKRAIELDPQYALAYAQLAYSYARIALLYEWNPFWFEQAKQSLNQADRLDPNLAESHVVRAFLYWSIYQNYQLDETLRELRLARQLNPNAGLTLLGDLGLHLGFEEETLRVLRRASEIDPTSVLIQGEIAEAYAWFGKWDEAIAAYDRVIAIEPNYQPPYHHGALCFLHKNQFGEAQRRLERALALNSHNPVPMSYRALLLALRGEFQKAEAEIPALIEKGEKLRSFHHVTYSFACIYALQGKTEPAVEWLKKTGETGMPNYPMFARDPYLERIRKDPAFIQFMAEIKARWEAYRREFGGIT